MKIDSLHIYIASRLNGKFKPIALIKTDEKPEDAIGPKSGRGGCVMAFIAQTIAKRKTTVFGRENATCGGIYPGFGWGDGFKTEAELIDKYCNDISGVINIGYYDSENDVMKILVTYLSFLYLLYLNYLN